MQNKPLIDLIKGCTNKPAIKNPSLVIELFPLMDLSNEMQEDLFMISLDRHNISERELIDGFLDAHEDYYTPSTGIQFKHIWKHIKMKRDNAVDMRKYL